MQSLIPASRRCARGFALVSAALLLNACLIHAAPTNPYRVIADANAFRLRPPTPPSVEAPPQPPKPQVTVKLTGLTTMFGNSSPRAFVEIQEAGKPAVKRTVLGLGERSDSVEIVGIDVSRGMARIRIEGEESVLTLAKPEANPIKPVAVAVSSVLPRR